MGIKEMLDKRKVNRIRSALAKGRQDVISGLTANGLNLAGIGGDKRRTITDLTVRNCFCNGFYFPESVFVNLKATLSSFGGSRFEGAKFVGGHIEETGFDGSNLRGTRWEGLQGAKWSFVRADLSRSEFSHICIEGGDFSMSNCFGVLFYECCFDGVNFFRADLDGAVFVGCTLKGAMFSETDVTRTKFISCDFEELVSDSSQRFEELVKWTCPKEGEFTAWKKALAGSSFGHREVIVELKIHKEAKRTSGGGKKCRCDMAEVVSITELNGEPAKYSNGNNVIKAFSLWDNHFIYEVGKTVHCKGEFNEDRFAECSSGIHFFTTREDAVNFKLV